MTREIKIQCPKCQIAYDPSNAELSCYWEFVIIVTTASPVRLHDAHFRGFPLGPEGTI